MPTDPDTDRAQIPSTSGSGSKAAYGGGELYRNLCSIEGLHIAYARAKEEASVRPPEPQVVWPVGSRDLELFLRHLSNDLSGRLYPAAVHEHDAAPEGRTCDTALRDLVVCAAVRTCLAPQAGQGRAEQLLPRAAADRVVAFVTGGLVRTYTIDLTRAYLASDLSRVKEKVRSWVDDPDVLALLDILAATSGERRKRFGPLFADLAYGDVERVLRQAEAIARTPAGGHLRWVRQGHELVVLADTDPAYEWVLPATQVRLQSELCTGLHYDAALLVARTTNLSRGGALRLFGFEFRANGNGPPRVRALVDGNGHTSSVQDRSAQVPGRPPLGVRARGALRRGVRAVTRPFRRGFGALVLCIGDLLRGRKPDRATVACGSVALICLSVLSWDLYAHSSGEAAAPGQPPGFYLGQYNTGSAWQPEMVMYGLYLPPHLRNEDGPFPLIVFLHGYGERTPDALFQEGLPRSIATKLGAHARRGRSRFEFVALFPIDPSGMWRSESFETADAMKAVEYVIRRHRVDRTRVYLTGMSNGANGVWGLAETHPDVWAALAPVSAFHQPNVPAVRHIPAWIFHGGNDRQAQIGVARWSVERLREAKADVRFTEFPGLGHRIGYKVYDDAGVYEWLATKRRPSP